MEYQVGDKIRFNARTLDPDHGVTIVDKRIGVIIETGSFPEYTVKCFDDGDVHYLSECAIEGLVIDEVEQNDEFLYILIRKHTDYVPMYTPNIDELVKFIYECGTEYNDIRVDKINLRTKEIKCLIGGD